MDKPVTKVIKSKSSNSAIASNNKTEKSKNKKSKSNGEFQPSSLKKRGVYVDNKTENLDTNGQVTTNPNTLTKAPQRPRPGQKRFLTSVLTILSKSSAGTQYPDVQVKYTVKQKNATKSNNVKTAIEVIKETEKKKKKFKSRVLNNKIDEKLIVLQSRKEIINTPSMYSEKSQDNINKTLQNVSECIVKEDTIKPNDDTRILLVKEILEGKQHRDQKKYIDNDPATLVAATNSKDDKGLYNFFVDLLQTTFSVYNLKAEFNEITANASTSKINLEIHESVANKLVIEMPVDSEDICHNLPNHYNCTPNDESIREDTDIVKHFLYNSQSGVKEELPRKVVKRKLRSNSYDYLKKLSSTPKNQSATSKKRNSKARRKQSLLQSLKEQLQMETETYEEPQNIYKALKIIARNKRKHQKSIRFSQPYKPEGDVCMFRRRKVISPSTRSPLKTFASEGPLQSTCRTHSSCSRKDYSKPDLTNLGPVSEHSLQVYGFDYEPSSFKRQASQKEIIFTYHSSPSTSGHDLDANEEILKYSESQLIQL